MDLGYLTEARGRIPAFHSIEEEAEFWYTHDFADFREETEPVGLVLEPELRRQKPIPPDAAAEPGNHTGEDNP